MGKNKDKKKSKKVDAVEPELTDKQRRKLEARAAELEAKLEAERKAEKKAKKKASKKSEPVENATRKPGDGKLGDPLVPESLKVPDDDTVIETPYSGEQIIAAAEAVLADKNASEGALKSARAAKAKALESLTDDDLKARVKAKAAARKALLATAEKVDRNDPEAVRAYNEELAAMGGGRFLTSAAEVEAERAKLREPEPEVAAHEAEKLRLAQLADAVVAPQVAEVVATESGDVIEVGPARDEAEEFAKPSDAPAQLEEGGRGYKIIMLGKDGKPDPKTIRQYTRVTTYIDCLEHKGALESWKLRTLLEGVALNVGEVGTSKSDDYLVAKVADAMHRRDVALKKARKADRKGKLEVGELAQLEGDAIREFKQTVDKIAEAALELGGVHEKANKGTSLHSLVETYVREGMGRINDMLKADEITKSEHADVVAFAEALAAIDAKVVASEVVIVNDALKYAGRLDLVLLVKLPGMARAVRVVADLKSGRVDLGAGKIAQQIAMYANGDEYNLETGERSPLKVSKAKGLLVHLPAGTAKATVHVVDLALGAKGNKLAGEVRAWRNEGKKAIDLATDLATIEKAAE